MMILTSWFEAPSEFERFSVVFAQSLGLGVSLLRLLILSGDDANGALSFILGSGDGSWTRYLGEGEGGRLPLDWRLPVLVLSPASL